MAFIFRAFRTSARLMKGWVIKNVLILLVLGALYFTHPRIAGLVSGALWVLLVMAPSLLQRLVVKRSMQQRFISAARWANFNRLLHPFDGWWHQGHLFGALGLAQEGRRDEAAEILNRLRTSGSLLAPTAGLHYFRLTGQWGPLIEWVESDGAGEALSKNPNILVQYLRALGETGRVEDLVITFHQNEAQIERGTSPVALLWVLMFTGRLASLERLLEGPLAALPDATKELWRATCQMAMGDLEPAQARLHALQSSADAAVRSLAERRLASPPPVAAERLTVQALERVDALEAKLLREAPVMPPPAQARRPYVMYGLIAANALYFLVEILRGGAMDPNVLVELGAVVPSRVLAGEVWRLFAASFLHAGFLHLALNMFALLLFAPLLENRLGPLRFLVVYLVASLGAMSSVVVVFTAMGVEGPLVGASGGVMGLVGATAFVLARIYFQNRASSVRQRLMRVLGLIALQSVFDFLTPQVSFIAHFSGVLFGFIACAAVGWRRITVEPPTSS